MSESADVAGYGYRVTFARCIAVGSRSYELLLTFESLAIYRH